MSVERYFHWTCNYCAAEVVKQPWGKPVGWFVIASDVLRKLPTRHACEKCGPRLNLRLTAMDGVWREIFDVTP